MKKILTTIAVTLCVSACGGGGEGASSAGSAGSTGTVTIPTTTAPSTGVVGEAVTPPVSVAPPVAEAKSPYEIGVYYYPGWHWDLFSGWKDPWAPIQAYPNLKPTLGWYDDTSNAVMQQQATWMSSYGISYVVFDWYYERGAVQADRPLQTFISLPGTKPKLSLLWANHSSATSAADWTAIVDRWVSYAKSANFYTIDQKPVFFIFNAQKFSDDADRAGASAAAWLTYARTTFKAAGLPEPYIVAGVFAGDEPIIRTAEQAGFSSVSAYNYVHAPRTQKPAYSYAELDDMYGLNWTATKNAGKLPLVVPITSGWDRTPWGGSTDKLRDNAIPATGQLGTHFAKAKAFMKSNNMYHGVVCCWNEFGEGSYIEPTVQLGMSRLEVLKDAFKAD